VLALGTIPALALAKSHVSLPTSNITVTPTSAMEAPATKTSSRVIHGKVSKASARRHSAKSRKGTALHHKKAVKGVSSHKKTASAKRKTVAGKTRTSSHKVLRVG
jgi:hypothetical protein